MPAKPDISRCCSCLAVAGVSNTELWNNLGLCCFYASQHDMALGCFERAFAMADDSSLADVWYSVGQVAVGKPLCQSCATRNAHSS